MTAPGATKHSPASATNCDTAQDTAQSISTGIPAVREGIELVNRRVNEANERVTSIFGVFLTFFVWRIVKYMVDAVLDDKPKEVMQIKVLTAIIAASFAFFVIFFDKIATKWKVVAIIVLLGLLCLFCWLLCAYKLSA